MIFKKSKTTISKSNFSSGFTLVEMLVVIAVIGILYLIVFGSVSDSKARGRDAKRIADIGVIQLALERYYDEFKKYPDTLSSLDSSVPKEDSLGNNYLYKALNSDNTATCSGSACQSYHLGIALELDNAILNDGDDDLDSDVSGDFDGDDDKDCNGGETGKCYDVVPKF